MTEQKTIDTGTEFLNLMMKALEEKYNEGRGDTVHISDLIMCPRESIYRKLQPLPITNTEVGFFLLGRSMHDAAQQLVTRYPEEGFIIENLVEFDGVEGHIDLWWSKRGVPVELKTARMADMENPKYHYLIQLHSYMAIKNADTGILIVFLVLHYQKGKEPLKRFIISMTPEQRLEKKIEILREAAGYRKALAAKDPGLARHIAYDNNLNWKCNSCKYLAPCQEKRKEEAMRK